MLLESKGISAEDVDGTFYLTALNPETGDLSTYTYSIGEDKFSLIPNTNNSSEVTMSNNETFFVTYFEAAEDEADKLQITKLYKEEDYIAPLVSQGDFYKERDLSLSPNGKTISYTARPELSSDNQDSEYLYDWQVVIHNLENDDIAIVEGAGNSKWLDDTRLVYLKYDGVYLYNIETNQEYKITTEYTGLDLKNGLAISPSSYSLILTLPQLNQVAVYSLSETKQERIISTNLKNTIEIEANTYFDPEFSPDGIFYALLKKDSDSESQSLNIETRSIVDPTPLTSHNLDSLFGDVVLEAWN